jgi:hypothetical protein
MSVVNNMETVEDDGWGSTEKSPMERVAGSTKTEYVVYKVNGNTFDTNTYTEKAIADALKKIKTAKQASENFGDKAKANVDISVDDDWDDNGFDNDDDSPWV